MFERIKKMAISFVVIGMLLGVLVQPAHAWVQVRATVQGWHLAGEWNSMQNSRILVSETRGFTRGHGGLSTTRDAEGRATARNGNGVQHQSNWALPRSIARAEVPTSSQGIHRTYWNLRPWGS